MVTILWEHIVTAKEKSWGWFAQHAQSPKALWWLALVAYTDAIVSPLVPEAFIAALVLAHKQKWGQYLAVGAIFSIAGAATTYILASFLFTQVGMPLIEWYGLGPAFMKAQTVIGGQVFLALALASFTPVPDKVFLWAGGFLQVAFAPFITGYALGRILRMAIVTVLVHRFGEHILTMLNRYFFWFTMVLLALLAVYGIVHWHIWPW